MVQEKGIADDRILIDSKSYALVRNSRTNIPLYSTVRSGEDLVDYWPDFGGPMGEYQRQTANGIYFGRGVDTADGTIRLSPTVTGIDNSIDCAYLPMTFFEDFDASYNHYLYCIYRDTAASPNISATKIRTSNDTLIYTQDSSSATAGDFGGAAVAALFAPIIGKAAVFEGKTFVPMGDNTGTNVLQRLTTVDVNASASANADTWDSADANGWAFTCGVVHEGITSKFVKAYDRKFNTVATAPLTVGGYGADNDVNDDGVTPVVWSLDAGVEHYIAKTDGFYSTDALGTIHSLLPVRIGTKKNYNAAAGTSGLTYDDYDGHMSCNVGDAFFHPSRLGVSLYRNGRYDDVGIDSIPGYRPVVNISNIPVRQRHFAMAAHGRHIYVIYKPTGFSNTANVHILYGEYREGKVTWRPFISRTDDILGLFIDSNKRLWWVENPKDPATTSGANTSHLKSVQLANDGSPRTEVVSATFKRGELSTTASCFLNQANGGRPFNRKQLRRVSLRIARLWVVAASGAVKVYRDGGTQESVGTFAPGISTTEQTYELNWTPGTNDKAYGAQLELQIITTGALSPSADDPAIKECALYWRSPDLMRCVITERAPENPLRLEEIKNALRKLKQKSAIIQIVEPGTNEAHDAEIVAVNDYIEGGEKAVEVLWHRFDIAA